MLTREELKVYTAEELERKKVNIWRQIDLAEKRRLEFKKLREKILFINESELINSLFVRVMDIEEALKER